MEKKDIPVLIFVFIMFFLKGIGLSATDKIYTVMYVVSLIFATVKIFNSKYKKKQFINIVILILIGLVNFIFNGETTILFTALLLFTIKDVNLKKIFKTIFLARFISYVFMIILPIFGITQMNVFKFYRASIGQFVNRYAFGFSHPNLAHSSFLLIIILIGYLFYNKINMRHLFLIEIINYILYTFTYSRTGFFLLTFYVTVLFLAKKSKRISGFICNNLNRFLFCFIIVSFLLAIGYNKIEFINKIDILLTGRISYMQTVFYNYRIPLISSNRYIGVLFDNGYFDLIYNGGFLAFIWFMYNQIKTNNIIKENFMIKEALMTLFLMFYSLFESYYPSIMMNVSLILFVYFMYDYNDEKCDKKMVVKISN